MDVIVMEQPKQEESSERCILEVTQEMAETARWETGHSDTSEPDITEQTYQENTSIPKSSPNHNPGLSSSFKEEFPLAVIKNVSSLPTDGTHKPHHSMKTRQHPFKDSPQDLALQEAEDREQENEFLQNSPNALMEAVKEEHREQEEYTLDDTTQGRGQNDSPLVGFDLKQCESCGRKFMTDRLEKHSKVCSKLKTKREVFNSKLKRIDHNELINEVSSSQLQKEPKHQEEPRNSTMGHLHRKQDIQPPKSRSTAATEKRPNWKVDHENFLKSIRGNRVLPCQSQLSSNDPHMKSYHVPLDNPDYVFCQFCERKFAPNVAEVHIPKCQHTFNRPNPPCERKKSFLKVLNSVEKKEIIRNAHTTKSTMVIGKSHKLCPLEIYPKEYHSKPMQQILKPKISIHQQSETFAGMIKNYQNVEARSSNYSHIECPFCSRRFAQKAAERHIPICQELNKNKPFVTVKEGSKKGERTSKLEPPSHCRNCGFKFSIGHKYCSNCGKKRAD